MSKLINPGICTCGCVEQSLRKTEAGRMFTQVGGLGYVEFDHNAKYDLRVWDEYFENTEEFAGETPVEYAITKTWQNFNHTNAKMPDNVFQQMVKNLRSTFTAHALDVLVDRDRFKEILGNGNHGLLGQLIMALEEEIRKGNYKTLTYWEINAIKSYDHVYRTEGKFASAKIAHNVRILLMQQYTLVMTALARLKLERGKELI